MVLSYCGILIRVRKRGGGGLWGGGAEAMIDKRERGPPGGEHRVWQVTPFLMTAKKVS